MWWGTAIEAPDPSALAAFYSQLLDWPIVHEEPGTAIVAPQGSLYIVFQQAEGYLPPAWPPVDGQQRTRMHFDFEVGDLSSAVTDAVALGAKVADFPATGQRAGTPGSGRASVLPVPRQRSVIGRGTLKH